MNGIEEVLLTNQNCAICGNNHNYKHCDYVKITEHVPDNDIPSRAKLTVPNSLKLQILTDGSYSVVARELVKKGTQYGPLQAEKIENLNPETAFPLKIFGGDENGNSEYFFDTCDENKCSWLIFVNPAEHLEEQNMICYQENGEIYYIAIKDIDAGDTLKVWYSPYYARKMNKPVLISKTEVDPLKNLDINTLIKKQQQIMERKTWTCKFCSHIENDIVSFAKHILKHYTAQLRKMCEICKKTFGSKKSLKSHFKIVHRSSFSPTVQPKPAKIVENVTKTQDVALGGPLLNDMFTDSTDLQQSELNLDLNIDNQNLLLDDNLTVENILNENVKDLDHFNFEIDDNQKQFVCDICLKQFTKVKLLIIHLKQHTGDFMCSNCLRIFCRKENLQSHTCNVDSHFTCNLCGKGFTLKKYLSRHLVAVHNKKYACINCEKVYHSNKELLDHNCSKISPMEKEKFMCPICDKHFYRDKYLRKHLKTHAQAAKILGVICEICGQTLEDKNSYYLHKKSHRDPPHCCEICDKKFHRADSLKQHVLLHQTKTEFECSICHKKFKTEKIMLMHTKLHNDQCFKCSFCVANFRQRASLNRHVRSCHKENNKIVIEHYSCPVCNKLIKLRSSLLRHLKRVHSDIKNIDVRSIKPKLLTKEVGQSDNNNDLKTSDELQAELDDQINSLLHSAENNSAIQKQAVDNLVKELDIDTKKEMKQREVCLSIPDLTEADQEITLDKHAYILDNGTIVQPQGDSDNVIIYVLDQGFT